MVATRTRRLRWLDWVLIGTLVPPMIVLLSLRVREGLAGRAPAISMLVSSAPSYADFPVVDRVFPGTRFEGDALEPGDRLLLAGDETLAGASNAQVALRAGAALLWPEGDLHLTVARGDQRFTTILRRTPRPIWWASIPFALASLFAGLIVLARAPEWWVRRRYFVASLATAIHHSSDAGLLGFVVPGAFLIPMAAAPISLGAFLSICWAFTASARPIPRWATAMPWVLGTGLAAGIAAMELLPRPTSNVGRTALVTLMLLWQVAAVVGLARAYRRSDAIERRQIRWFVYGVYLAALAVVVLYSGLLLGAVSDATNSSLGVAFVSLLYCAVPIGLLVSIFGYRFLDIDRVISATTSYTIVGVILLGVALQVIPRAAEAAGALGLSPATGQWVLSIAVAGAAIQGHRWLRPWLDRRMFAQRVAVEEGLAQLVHEIGVCTGAQEITRLSGERIDALLRPESIAVYAREGDAFTPVFARAAAAPPAFVAESPLVKTLESRSAPLVATSDSLDAFDRAALATLAAEVVVPTRRGAALAAFTCLGRKRSGDIYTPAELALLTAVASASGSVLQRMGDAEVLDQARAMQASLRRYVPGAIAEQLESGRDLQAGEREVTVLFVDLRGYTAYAEKRPPDDVFSTVNEHTERTSEIVRRRGGAVVEFNGDGMMAVFGAPEALADKERRAVESAREIVDTSSADLPVGIGIATGLAYAGNIRAADRWIWSVIGDTTNLAARLQALTRELGAAIATDEPTRRAAGYVCADFTRHRDVPLRGRSERVDVFALPLARADSA